MSIFFADERAAINNSEIAGCPLKSGLFSA